MRLRDKVDAYLNMDLIEEIKDDKAIGENKLYRNNQTKEKKGTVLASLKNLRKGWELEEKCRNTSNLVKNEKGVGMDGVKRHTSWGKSNGFGYIHAQCKTPQNKLKDFGEGNTRKTYVKSQLKENKKWDVRDMKSMIMKSNHNFEEKLHDFTPKWEGKSNLLKEENNNSLTRNAVLSYLKIKKSKKLASQNDQKNSTSRRNASSDMNIISSTKNSI